MSDPLVGHDGLSLDVLVDFHRCVDLADEKERCVKADGSRQQPKRHHHHDRVGEVDQRRHELVYVQLSVKVEHGIAENVERSAARDDERPPPPVVVFGAQLEVNHDDADLGTRHDKDHKDEEKESEQVVKLVLVDGAEDEEEFDEAGAEGQDTGDQGAGD